ncbi:MAG: hypothetical protein JNL11_01675 [Bdellovibrionaceae bacterium]|nr:hypothetical protein [Pseudobdellovibrionaceae bacterium]
MVAGSVQKSNFLSIDLTLLYGSLPFFATLESQFKIMFSKFKILLTISTIEKNPFTRLFVKPNKFNRLSPYQNDKTKEKTRIIMHLFKAFAIVWISL